MDKLIDTVLATIKAVSDRLSDRMTALEQRRPVDGAKGDTGAPGRDGRDADASAVLALQGEIAALRGDLERTKAAPPMGDWQSAVRALVIEAVAQIVPALVADEVKRALVDVVDAATAEQKIATEVTKAVAALPRSLTVNDVAPLIASEVTKAIAQMPTPKDGAPGEPGRSVDLDAVRGLVNTSVDEALKTWPKPEDGRSVTAEDVAPLITSEITKAIAALPVPKDGEPGQSVGLDDVRALVVTAVTQELKTWTRPQDGRSVTAEDVAPLITAEVTKAVAALPAPKDGIGMMGALIDRDGRLMLTCSDGATKDLGPVVGRDVDMAEVARLITTEVAKLPRPKDGQDGLGFDDFEELYDGERTFTHRYRRGDQVKEFVRVVPYVLDRGVYRDGQAYVKGDGVSFGGSFWIAQKDTTAKPDQVGEASRAWRLAVKHGRDGKSVKGDPGPPGIDGRPGRDLTQTDGKTKW